MSIIQHKLSNFILNILHITNESAYWGKNKSPNVSPFHIFKHEMDYKIDIFGLSICCDATTGSSLAWLAWWPTWLKCDHDSTKSKGLRKL